MSLDLRAVVGGAALLMTACSAEGYRLTGLSQLQGTRFAYLAADSSSAHLTRSAGESVGEWTLESIQIERETVVLRSGDTRLEVGFGRLIPAEGTSHTAAQIPPLSQEAMQQTQRSELAAQMTGRAAHLPEPSPVIANANAVAGVDLRSPIDANSNFIGSTDESPTAPSNPDARPPRRFAPKPPTPDQIYRSRYGDDAYLEAVAQKRSLTEAP